MRLKSPTNEPISFGTSNGSGHSMVLGPEGDDVPQSEKAEPLAVPRTTIIIQPKRTLETPKEFGKKSNSNKIWVAVIVVLVLVIAYLLVQLFAGGGAGSGG